MLIFDNSHAKQNVAVVIYHPGILGKALSKHPEPLLVQEIRPLSFSQANRNHFDQSGLIGAAESGVPLDPANHNDGVGLKGEAIHANRIPVRHFPYLHRLHTGEDGAFTELLRDAVALQNIALPLCGGPAMAAHRGDDIGLCPLPL